MVRYTAALECGSGCGKRRISAAVVGALLLVAARAFAEPADVYVATETSGGLEIGVLRDGRILEAGPSGGRFGVFAPRSLVVRESELEGALQSISAEPLPRLRVRNDFELFAFRDLSTDGEGVAAVGSRGPRVVLALGSREGRLQPDAALSPGGEFLGLVIEGNVSSGEDESSGIALIDLREPWPSSRPIALPEGFRIEPDSFVLTSDAAFLAAEDDAGARSVFRAVLSPPVADAPAGAERIAGPFEDVPGSMARSRDAVAFVAGGDEDELDVFVARATGPAVNVTSLPAGYLQNVEGARRLAVSAGGTYVAYGLESGADRELFLHRVARPGPAGRFHVTSDERFNPYIDQESLIFFVPDALVFGAGHDLRSLDLFRLSTTGSRETINLTRTGTGLSAPFLRTGVLRDLAALEASGDLLLVSGGRSEGPALLRLLSTATGETVAAISRAAGVSRSVALGDDLIFSVPAIDGGWRVFCQTGGELLSVLESSNSDEPRPIAVTRGAVYWAVPEIGLLEAGEGGAFRLLDPASGRATSALVASGGRRLLLSVEGRDGIELRRLDVETGVVVSTSPAPAEAVLLFPALGEGRFLRGDANGDRRTDVSDPIATLSHLFQGRPIHCEDAADANDDGRLDLSDAVLSLQALFLGGVTFPPPYPDPGFDPTEDGARCPEE